MKRIATLLFCLSYLHCYAQNNQASEKPAYPQNYFRNPLDIPIFLAGNFGECRPGHFHSGLDIKTNGEENQPVYAAADGYISRIKMDKAGFGHAIYITHPNGYTTLYAHLNDFAPELQAYLRKEQYKQEKWDIEIQFTASQFPVTKGQQIAWSGNTGGSTAPHLHFEIRDNKTEHPLNPELFGLPFIDKEAPIPHELAVYDMDRSIYEQSPQVFPLQKHTKTYTPKADTVISFSADVGIGLNVDDYMDGSTNTLAFYSAKLFLDDSLQSEIVLDNIGYEETRYVNAYADYKTKEQQKKWIQCFFKLPGNMLGHIYHNINRRNGVLVLSGEHAHKIRVEIVDAKQNISIVSFYLKHPEPYASPAPHDCTPFKAGQDNSFAKENVMFSLGKETLYDDVCFQYRRAAASDAYSETFMLHHSYVPLHHFFELEIKPNKVIPFSLHDKIALIYTDGKDTNGKAAWPADKGWYKASVRDFGTYWLVADTTAPVIKPAFKNGADLNKATQILFTVKDDLTSVKRYRGEIDGKWVCFEQHDDRFFYNFDEHCPKGKHELMFTASDENGNTQTVHYTFIR